MNGNLQLNLLVGDGEWRNTCKDWENRHDVAISVMPITFALLKRIRIYWIDNRMGKVIITITAFWLVWSGVLIIYQILFAVCRNCYWNVSGTKIALVAGCSCSIWLTFPELLSHYQTTLIKEFQESKVSAYEKVCHAFVR